MKNDPLACFSTMDGLDVGHAAQVRLDNMPDAVWEQHAVKVLTGLRGSMALNPYLFARVAECQPRTGSLS